MDPVPLPVEFPSWLILLKGESPPFINFVDYTGLIIYMAYSEFDLSDGGLYGVTILESNSGEVNFFSC